MKQNSQNGSVLFYILIGVVLFAALGFAVSSMMRGSPNLGGEKTGLMVDEILGYARSVRQAVQTMRISNGCEENEISFERSPFDGSDTSYVNASAPADFSCHVFHPDGGGVGYMSPPTDIGGAYFFTGQFGVSGLGSDSNAELTLILPGLNLTQCAAINTKLGLPAPATDPSSSTAFFTTEFTGSYALGGAVGSTIGTGDAIYNNQAAGCFFENSATSGQYFFYQVLMAR